MSNPTNKSWQEELEAEKKIAFASGILLGDVTVRNLLESVAEAIVIVESSSRIVVANTRTEELFGYSKEELFGQPLAMLLPEEVREAHERHVSNFFENPRMRPMGLGLSLAGMAKDGERIPIEVSLGYLQTTIGVLGLAFVTDIRSRKRAEDQLRQSHADLEAFARTVAHDLTTPLIGLVAASDLVASSVGDAALTRRLVTEIQSTCRNLVSVVRELLAFATLSGREVEVVPVDMAPIVERVLDRLKLEVEKRGARIAVQADMPRALGYGPWIEEIWFNYLSNALKHGGNNPVIEIGGEVAPEGRVRFWVQDQGPGIAAPKRERLFAKGQINPHAEGHGLGLAIVARIAERLGGTVFVETDADQGSRFGIVLPSA